MPHRLGPFDTRLIRKRCSDCAKFHLKCGGGRPCRQCRASGRRCEPSTIVRKQLQFQPAFCGLKPPIPGAAPPSPRPSLTLCYPDRCVTYFFVTFLQRHDFTGLPGEDFADLQVLMHSAECLQTAIIAISTLDAEMRQQARRSTGSSVAIHYYQEAISLVRSELRRGRKFDDVTNSELLWTTLLLGIWELMYDASGHGFNIHFIRGTSALLRSQSPSHFINAKTRSFLRILRIFEVARSVAYWEATFLEDPPWRTAIDDMVADGTPLSGSFMLESMFKLIGRFSNLKASVKTILQGVQLGHLDDNHSAQLMHMARRACDFRDALEAWYQAATTQMSILEAPYYCRVASGESSAPPKPTDPRPLLALIYYHSLSLNIASLFNSHPHHAQLRLHSPSHSPPQTQDHVSTILSLLAFALKHTSLAGIQLLWPIRAAGTHSVNLEDCACAIKLLTEIEGRGLWSPDGIRRI